MADNDRFVIQKIQTNKKCFFREQDGIESHPRTRCLIDPQSYYYVFDSDCKKCKEGKTIEEYEDMIAESIYSVIKKDIPESDNLMQQKVYNDEADCKIKQISKAVVGRLFGEGE